MFNRRLLTQILTAFITLALVFVCHQTNTSVIKTSPNSPGNTLTVVALSNRDFLNQKLQQILDNRVAQGVPGVTMYIKTADGWTWSGASGFSNLQQHTPMKASDRFRIMSATKMKETFSEGTLDNVIDWAFGKGSKPPTFAPGTGFEYSDTNTIVAELIVQQVTGNPLALEIRDRILTPLGLKNTYMERVET